MGCKQDDRTHRIWKSRQSCARHRVHRCRLFPAHPRKAQTSAVAPRSLFRCRLCPVRKDHQKPERHDALRDFLRASLRTTRLPGEALWAGFTGFLMWFYPVHPVIPSKGFSPRQKPLNACSCEFAGILGFRATVRINRSPATFQAASFSRICCSISSRCRSGRFVSCRPIPTAIFSLTQSVHRL